MAISILGLLLAIVVAFFFLAVVALVGVSLWKSNGITAVLVVAGVVFVLWLGMVSLLSVRMERATAVTTNDQIPNGHPGQSIDVRNYNDGQGAVVIQSFPGTVVDEIAPPSAPVTPQPAGIPAPNAMVSTSVGNPSWMDTDEDVFAIDHFPSVASAVGPLVRETMAKLEESEGSSTDAASDDTDEKRVYVWVKGADSKAFENEVVELVRSILDGWDVQITNGVQLKSLTLDLELQLRGGYLHVAAWDKDAIIQKGSMRCTAYTSGGKTFTSSKQFDAKPWVHSFDQFVTDYPRRRFLVGYSSGVHSSENEARRAAMDDVRVKAEPEYGTLSYFLAEEPNVLDRFAQKLERPYGVVWREAVLVEVTPNSVRMAQARMPGSGPQRGPSQAWLIFSLAIITSVAVVLCSLLNWITEGYYRGRWLALGLGGMLVSTMLLVITMPGF